MQDVEIYCEPLLDLDCILSGVYWIYTLFILRILRRFPAGLGLQLTDGPTETRSDFLGVGPAEEDRRII